jgi:hypothetical protein
MLAARGGRAGPGSGQRSRTAGAGRLSRTAGAGRLSCAARAANRRPPRARQSAPSARNARWFHPSGTNARTADFVGWPVDDPVSPIGRPSFRPGTLSPDQPSRCRSADRGPVQAWTHHGDIDIRARQARTGRPVMHGQGADSRPAAIVPLHWNHRDSGPHGGGRSARTRPDSGPLGSGRRSGRLWPRRACVAPPRTRGPAADTWPAADAQAGRRHALPAPPEPAASIAG